jgi:hypothetical protein
VINLRELEKEVEEKTGDEPALPPPSARALGELVLPPEDDPSELLKHRFLCRGAGMLLVGPTGVGKSALAMQAMILWALGREAFGIKPARALKSLLVQAENDDGDLAEMRDGVIRGLALSDEDRARACEMVLVVREDQRTGFAFMQGVLRPPLEEHKPDLLWIDPALSYLGGEASSQKDVGGFLRNMLNPLLREFGCGCIILHHTNKPPAGREKPDWQAGDFAYLGSGSIEWAGWARCVVALRSVGSHSVFEFRACKRGSRLRWKEEDGETTAYAKLIAHAKGAGQIYWREPDPDEIPKEPTAKRVPAKGDVLAHVPIKEAISKNELRDKANAAGIALNRINPLIDDLIGDGSLFVWSVKRKGTNPRILLARFPQAEGTLV